MSSKQKTTHGSYFRLCARIWKNSAHRNVCMIWDILELPYWKRAIRIPQGWDVQIKYLVDLDLAGQSVLIYNDGWKPFQEALSSF